MSQKNRVEKNPLSNAIENLWTKQRNHVACLAHCNAQIEKRAQCLQIHTNFHFRSWSSSKKITIEKTWLQNCQFAHPAWSQLRGLDGWYQLHIAVVNLHILLVRHPDLRKAGSNTTIIWTRFFMVGVTSNVRQIKTMPPNWKLWRQRQGRWNAYYLGFPTLIAEARRAGFMSARVQIRRGLLLI